MSGSRVLVLGLGVSGSAAVQLLLSQGHEVVCLDESQNSRIEGVAEMLSRMGAKVIYGCKAVPSDHFDLCVTSPGIPHWSALITEVNKRRIPVVPELEFGWRNCKAPVIAVTGSNGKSTAVKLCAEVLSEAGQCCEAGGNYGKPLSEIALEDRPLDWIVAEVSSFQLEYVMDFHPAAAVILNISDDHLDRHGSQALYSRLKFRIFEKMTNLESKVIEENLESEVRLLYPDKRGWVSFGSGRNVDVRYSDGCIFFKNEKIELTETRFSGETAGKTVAAVWALVQLCGVKAESMRRALRKFCGLPHRMEFAGEFLGRKFVDDSKATNIAALCAGLEMCSGPVLLIAGGVLKEKNLDKAKELLEMHVKGLYVLGRQAHIFLSAWQDAAKSVKCDNMKEAVRQAWGDSAPGDTILLSPGAASFDFYRNFEERGKDFKKEVMSIINKESSG